MKPFGGDVSRRQRRQKCGRRRPAFVIVHSIHISTSYNRSPSSQAMFVVALIGERPKTINKQRTAHAQPTGCCGFAAVGGHSAQDALLHSRRSTAARRTPPSPPHVSQETRYPLCVQLSTRWQAVPCTMPSSCRNRQHCSQKAGWLDAAAAISTMPATRYGLAWRQLWCSMQQMRHLRGKKFG